MAYAGYPDRAEYPPDKFIREAKVALRRLFTLPQPGQNRAIRELSLQAPNTQLRDWVLDQMRPGA